MNNNLNENSSSESNSSHFQMIGEREAIKHYLLNCMTNGNNAGSEILAQLETDTDTPVVLLKGSTDYFHADLDALLLILQDFDIFLDPTVLTEELESEFDNKFLYGLVNDFYDSCLKKESELKGLLNRSTSIPLLPLGTVEVSAKYEMLKITLDRLLYCGIPTRTLIAIGGLDPKIYFVDEAAFILDPKNKEFFLKVHANQYLLFLHAKRKEILDSLGYRGQSHLSSN